MKEKRQRIKFYDHECTILRPCGFISIPVSVLFYGLTMAQPFLLTRSKTLIPLNIFISVSGLLCAGLIFEEEAL